MATLEIVIRDDDGKIRRTVRPRASALTMREAARLLEWLCRLAVC